ncbi:MAG: DUF1624 domain-containing protein [Clostridia bacterium]|nr:DUF1624 domain-containing protein [Clostridia bacterium]
MQRKNRINLFDTIRGFALISMILYHFTYDAVMIFGQRWTWFSSEWASVWQTSIFVTFIFLSGAVSSLSEKGLKRGLTVLGGGLLVTAVTLLFMPNQKILFGVLSFLGCAMIIKHFLNPVLNKINSVVGLLFSAVFFILTYNLPNSRFFIWDLPEALNSVKFLFPLGITYRGFFSADYFPIFPWIFLFFFGMFLCKLTLKRLPEKIKNFNIRPISFLGRHTLEIYIAHQPILYALCYLIF